MEVVVSHILLPEIDDINPASMSKTIITDILRKDLKFDGLIVTDDMTMQDILEIAEFVKNSNEIDELSFRQMVDSNYNTSSHLHDELKAGHKKDWWYIEQCDYNLYYAENHLYKRYEDLKVE